MFDGLRDEEGVLKPIPFPMLDKRSESAPLSIIPLRVFPELGPPFP